MIVCSGELLDYKRVLRNPERVWGFMGGAAVGGQEPRV
ncbi:MAG: hypothetical protein Ct9H300mP15_03700 [Gemmatimonadota bacterium]|nr:MAG: hypothetical protein Ct9H300mP15_03700 [Gemmatimonadota bacterium]